MSQVKTRVNVWVYMMARAIVLYSATQLTSLRYRFPTLEGSPSQYKNVIFILSGNVGGLV